MNTNLLLKHAYIHSTSEPYANSLYIENGIVAWLGSDDAAERMLAATVSEPYDIVDVKQQLVTPAFVDGYTTMGFKENDSRWLSTMMTPHKNGIYYKPLHQKADIYDGIFVDSPDIENLNETLSNLKAPGQLMINSETPDQLDEILDHVSKIPSNQLMRSRHRILLNHGVTETQIGRIHGLNLSITVYPEIIDGRPVVHAPVKSLIREGVHVAAGSGDWDGSFWDILTALIEHQDQNQSISTRAAFNTASRDGIRVLPSRVGQQIISAGQLAIGSPANLNIWNAAELGVQAPDEKAAHWSTDKRAGTALLPILGSAIESPRLEYMIRKGIMS